MNLEEKAREFWDVERSWGDGSIELVRLLRDVEQAAFEMAAERVAKVRRAEGHWAADIIRELAKERIK